MHTSTVRLSAIAGFFFLVFVIGAAVAGAEEPLTGFDLTAKQAASNCRDEVAAEFEKLVASNTLSLAQLFDTFYIPIPNTNPQKFHTQYDRKADDVLRIILDKYLDQEPRYLFVVAVDKNGYLPTHNTRYSRPLTEDEDYNTKNNRTKRIFNDRTGLAAARNTQPYLLQTYKRDTGETLSDLSVPIFVQGKHWGAIRIGYKR
ncbi:MAG: chemotaxis protein [Pseudomonadota bacterium]